MIAHLVALSSSQRAQRLAKFLRNFRWIAIEKISNSWDPSAQAETGKGFLSAVASQHTAAWIAIIRKWERNGNSIKMDALEICGFLETNNFVFLPILG